MPDDAPSDADLWARGDERAFGELYDRYAKAVWNHAYRLTASWSTAPVNTGETFSPNREHIVARNDRNEIVYEGGIR